jgi:glutathione S-transferase
VTRRQITLPLSPNSEKARWALDYTRLPYVEDRHLPLLHWAATRRAGGGRTVPVLVTDDGVFPDSSDIVRYADRHAAPADRLLPTDAHARAACDALEDEFDERLGPAVRRFGYHHAFADRRIVLTLARQAGPGWQVALLRLALPAVRAYMMRALGITERSADASHALVRGIFDDVGARLCDGRRYLLGDRFTTADLTFAALAAPYVLPPEHPFPPPAERFPPPVHDLWRAMRAHPAGAFVLRVYADERRAQAPERARRPTATTSSVASTGLVR